MCVLFYIAVLVETMPCGQPLLQDTGRGMHDTNCSKSVMDSSSFIQRSTREGLMNQNTDVVLRSGSGALSKSWWFSKALPALIASAREPNNSHITFQGLGCAVEQVLSLTYHTMHLKIYWKQHAKIK